MAATIRSLLNSAPLTEVVGASRQDLQIGDTVNLISVDSATTYLWTLAYAPTDKDGGASTAAFLAPENNNSSTANFIVDKEGSYLVRLIVDQGLGSEDTQFLRFRVLTEFGRISLVAAGERRDSTALIPADADATGWADDQNENLLKINNLLSKVSSSGRILYVDANRGSDYSNDPNDVEVAKGYGDYSTINAATAAALAHDVPPSSDNPFMIVVRPGLYVEDVVISPWVYIVASDYISPAQYEALHPVVRTVTVRCENLGGTGTHSATTVDANEICAVRGISFENVSNGTTQSVMVVSGPGAALFEGCSFVQEASGPGVGSSFQVDGSWGITRHCFFGNYDTTNDLNPSVEVFGDDASLMMAYGYVAGPCGVDVNEPLDSNVQFSASFSVVEATSSNVNSYCVRAVPTALSISDSTLISANATTELQINPGQDVFPFASVSLTRSVLRAVVFDTTNITTKALTLWDVDYDSLSVLPAETSLTAGGVLAGGSAKSLFYDNTASGLTAESVQDALDEMASGAGGYDVYENGLVKRVIDSGDTFTIPADFQYIVSEELVVDGTLVVDGELVVLGALGEFSTQTTNATPTSATTVSVPSGSAALIKVFLSANRSTGAERAAFQMTALVYNTGAGATLGPGGVQADFTDKGALTWAATIVVSGSNAVVQVTGAAGATINWSGRVEYQLSST